MFKSRIHFYMHIICEDGGQCLYIENMESVFLPNCGGVVLHVNEIMANPIRLKNAPWCLSPIYETSVVKMSICYVVMLLFSLSLKKINKNENHNMKTKT